MVSPFEKHLFISYAHIDNQPLTPRAAGLDQPVSRLSGRHAQHAAGTEGGVWRDAKLAGNDIFANEIVGAFSRTALMVSVLSPRYVNSDWCTREIRELCEAAGNSGGVVVQNKSRVIKVIKTPIDNEENLPEVIRNTLGYQFFVFDDDQATAGTGSRL